MQVFKDHKVQVLWAAGGQAPPGSLADVLPAYARVRGSAKASAASWPVSART